MATTSPDVSPRTSAVNNGGIDRLGQAHRSLRSGEAIGEEAIASMVTAGTEFVRAFLPAIVTEPVRTLDIIFEFVQQSVSLQRRLMRELLGSVQVAMADAASDQPLGTAGAGGESAPPSDSSRSSARTAA